MRSSLSIEDYANGNFHSAITYYFLYSVDVHLTINSTNTNWPPVTCLSDLDSVKKVMSRIKDQPHGLYILVEKTDKALPGTPEERLKSEHSCHPFVYFLLCFCLFGSVVCMWDHSFPTMDGTYGQPPPHWKCRTLANIPPGKSLLLCF